jgi:hypothetical protein
VGSLFQCSLPGDGAGCRVESPGGTTFTPHVLPGPDFICHSFLPDTSSTIEDQTLCRAASVAASAENDPAWQQEELHILQALDRQLRWALAKSQRAQLYLQGRGIPLKTALEAGVGYLPSTLFNRPEMHKARELLHRWVDRLLFPLTSPFGRGYIGRSLWYWQPGMNETIHKALLERPGSPRSLRWLGLLCWLSGSLRR